MAISNRKEVITTIVISILVTLVIVISLSFYGYHFRQLSNEQEDWAFFGDYLSGVFSMFNIILLVLFGLYIRRLDIERAIQQDNLDQKRASDQRQIDLERAEQIELLDEKRIKLQIETQKKITIAQFRTDALNELEKNFVILTFFSDKEPTAGQIMNARIALMEFMNSKSSLFPLLKKEKFREFSNGFAKSIIDLRTVIAGPEHQDRDIIASFMAHKSEFFIELQNFIIKELE